jgi:hypothetical protein
MIIADYYRLRMRRTVMPPLFGAVLVLLAMQILARNDGWRVLGPLGDSEGRATGVSCDRRT